MSVEKEKEEKEAEAEAARMRAMMAAKNPFLAFVLRKAAKDQTFRGTMAHTAPELFEQDHGEPAGAEASRTSDMYALGTLFWEVLANRQPWLGRQVYSRLGASLACGSH